ncbi:alkyl sulfatase dimerization domain-containing protein [Micromonospora sp. BRA006-A]|nr:alkyl sulfatase dimerization domain-containing protein [Micromonospora sp. BRA006-A]
MSALLAQPWLRPRTTIRSSSSAPSGAPTAAGDGDPATVRPAPRAGLAAEVAQLAGGASRLAERALDAADRGRLDLAGHLAEWAALSAPEDRDAAGPRRRVRAARRRHAGVDGAGHLHLGTGRGPGQGRRRRPVVDDARGRWAP